MLSDNSTFYIKFIKLLQNFLVVYEIFYALNQYKIIY